jgi:hypothetical protein
VFVVVVVVVCRTIRFRRLCGGGTSIVLPQKCPKHETGERERGGGGCGFFFLHTHHSKHHHHARTHRSRIHTHTPYSTYILYSIDRPVCTPHPTHYYCVGWWWAAAAARNQKNQKKPRREIAPPLPKQSLRRTSCVCVRYVYFIFTAHGVCVCVCVCVRFGPAGIAYRISRIAYRIETRKA